MPSTKNQVPERGDVRCDAYGKMTCMAVADGYVMCRRPRAMPLVKSLSEWLSLRTEQEFNAFREAIAIAAKDRSNG